MVAVRILIDTVGIVIRTGIVAIAVAVVVTTAIIAIIIVGIEAI